MDSRLVMCILKAGAIGAIVAARLRLILFPRAMGVNVLDTISAVRAIVAFLAADAVRVIAAVCTAVAVRTIPAASAV